MTRWLRWLLHRDHVVESAPSDEQAHVSEHAPRLRGEDEESRRQREGLKREELERCAVDNQLENILRQFEGLADPRLIRRLHDK